jgi:hypothetical protein
LRDETRRNAMGDNAYKLGREMVWSNTAGRYMSTFELARRQAAVAHSKAESALPVRMPMAQVRLTQIAPAGVQRARLAAPITQ